MEKKNVGTKTITSGLLWTFGERITAQLVSTIVGVILARILMPEDYGIISIVMVFITVCNVFVTAGFGSSVVQKRVADEEDFNTAFVLSLILSVALYIILFFAAPIIAGFYQMEILKPVIRVLGVRLIISALNNIQQAYIQREMKFRKFFIATLFGTIVSCFVGIAMAYAGFGVWAIVAQYLTNTTVDTIVLCFVCGWNPKAQFSKKKAKEIFSFGWKVLCTQLLSTIQGDIRSLIIGKAFGASDLAFYDQGKKYPALLVNNLNSSIVKVMLPAYSRSQDNKEQLKFMLRKSIRVAAYLLSPIMIGFLTVSQTFVHVVLTDKWINAIPYIQIFCVLYLTRPFQEMCHQALLALGRSDIALKIMVIIETTALGSVVIAVFVFKSVLYIAVFHLAATFISQMCFLMATNRLLDYHFKEVAKDLAPSIILSLIMGIIVYGIGSVIHNALVSLVVQAFVGLGFYLFFSALFKLEPFAFIKNYVLSRIRKRA